MLIVGSNVGRGHGGVSRCWLLMRVQIGHMYKDNGRI